MAQDFPGKGGTLKEAVDDAAKNTKGKIPGKQTMKLRFEVEVDTDGRVTEYKAILT